MIFTFATVVNKEYQRFIPIFCWFFLKTFPESKIHLFLTEKLEPEIKELLAHVYTGVGGIIQIDYTYKDFPKKNQQLKSIRWILSLKHFTTHVYIGDIDMLIVDKGLPDAHVKHCMEQNLPYSNELRPNDNKRLTGLQWCMYDYFEAMQEVQEGGAEILMNAEKTNRFQNPKYRNEHFLYDLILEAGLGFPTDHFRPHHGIHLGLWRDGHVISEAQHNSLFVDDNYDQYMRVFDEYIQDPNFELIAERSNVPELGEFIKWKN